MSFRADPEIGKIVLGLARQAATVSKQKFGERLDFSLRSIKLLDNQLQQFHEMVIVERPTDKELSGFAQLYGAYLGEVIRLAHGGEWGICDLADQSQETALLVPGPGAIFPVSKVYRRILEGAEENVWAYYELTVKYDLEHRTS